MRRKRMVVGGLSTHSWYLLQGYHDAYFPNVQIDQVDPSTVRGEMLRLKANDDAMLVILSNDLYNMCIGLCDRYCTKTRCIGIKTMPSLSSI